MEDTIGLYLLKVSKDAKKISKKYTELNNVDFIVKYFQTNCKIPSESKLEFVEKQNKNPKETRNFLKNPVITQKN